MKFRIVEEVPSVPVDERWYIEGPGIMAGSVNFARRKDAIEYLHGQGVMDDEIVTEYFEP